MKANEVHKLSLDEIKVEEARLRRSLYDLRCQAVTEKLENPRQLRNIRRDVARLMTEKQARKAKESA
ncbi:MAG: 50S ribosomal protein L29 [Planctomycetota bacterium]|nr:50S ribosomal protein L29 [Planctomycetota bacterium]